MARIMDAMDGFLGGQWDRLADGRQDVASYQQSCRKMENYITTVQGAAIRRPGTKFIAETIGGEGIIAPLYDGDTTYIISLTLDNSNDDIYWELINADSGSSFADGNFAANSKSGVTPYPSQFQYRAVQGRTYFTHPNLHPFYINSSGPTALQSDFPALQSENTDTSAIITVGAVSGGPSLTLTATGHAPFTTDMPNTFLGSSVGQVIALRCIPQILHNEWTASTSYTLGDYVWSESYETPGRVNVYKAQASGSSGTIPPGHDLGTESDGSLDWKFVHSEYGFIRIEGVTNTSTATCSVIGFPEIPNNYVGASGTGDFRWAFGHWSREYGYPKSLEIHQGRLVFGGNENAPMLLAGSEVGVFTNHSATSTADNKPYTFELDSDGSSEINALSSLNGLIANTRNGTFRISGSDQSAITPTNVLRERISNGGFGPIVKAWDKLLWFNGAEQAIVQVEPARQGVESRATEVNPFIRQLLEDEATAQAVDRPEFRMAFDNSLASVIWIVAPQFTINEDAFAGFIADLPSRGGGRLIGITYDPSLGISAPHVHEIGDGHVSDVVYVEKENALYLQVGANDIDQRNARIERLSLDDKCYLDSYVSSSIAASTSAGATISGLSHLNSKSATVVIETDEIAGASNPTDKQWIMQTSTVSSGQVTTEADVTRPSIAYVGLAYNSEINIRPPSQGSRAGSNFGRRARISNVSLRLRDTAPGLKVGVDSSRLTPVEFRTDITMDRAVDQFSGISYATPIQSGHDEEQSVIIKHDIPLRSKVLSVYSEYHVEDS